MIVEKIHNKRLKEQGISICSKYKSNDTILERNTDKTKRNDNIQNGICLEKDYYKNNKLLIKEYLNVMHTFEVCIKIHQNQKGLLFKLFFKKK